MSTELRLFRAEDRFHVKGRGDVYTGLSPVAFWRDNALKAFEGEWLISHPDARHDCTYRVIGVECWCINVIREGAPIGLLVEPTEPTA